MKYSFIKLEENVHRAVKMCRVKSFQAFVRILIFRPESTNIISILSASCYGMGKSIVTYV